MLFCGLVAERQYNPPSSSSSRHSLCKRCAHCCRTPTIAFACKLFFSVFAMCRRIVRCVDTVAGYAMRLCINVCQRPVLRRKPIDWQLLWRGIWPILPEVRAAWLVFMCTVPRGGCVARTVVRTRVISVPSWEREAENPACVTRAAQNMFHLVTCREGPSLHVPAPLFPLHFACAPSGWRA